MKLKNKRGAVFSLVEAGFLAVIVPVILFSLGTIATKSYTIYNEYKIKHYVLEENIKINKALGGIRFANGIDFVDESPTNHPHMSQIRLSLPESKEIYFQPIDLGEDLTNDLQFFNTGEEFYVYNTDFIDFKKFEITVLDSTINRTSLKLDIIVGIDGKNNEFARSKFGSKEYYLDYSTTLTLRNNNAD